MHLPRISFNYFFDLEMVSVDSVARQAEKLLDGELRKRGQCVLRDGRPLANEWACVNEYQINWKFIYNRKEVLDAASNVLFQGQVVKQSYMDK